MDKYKTLSEEEFKRIRKEIEKMTEFEIVATILIYKNLRMNYEKLVEDILGKDYYNQAIDTYSCDAITCQDLSYSIKHSFKPFGWIRNLITKRRR